MSRWAVMLTCVFCGAALAQSPAAQPLRISESRIEGKVVNDLNGLPLRRARIMLRPTETGKSTIGVEGDDKGEFVIKEIDPGRYTLVAERDGFLSSAVCLKGTLRMPPVITVDAKLELTGVTFRLRPWAVMAGRVKFDDGEPAPAIRVDAYREYHYRGRQGHTVVMSALTNDRGEYRMFGLEPGGYLVAAAYERAPLGAGYKEQPRTDTQGRELPALTYTTTFYPNTTKLTEAVAVRLEYGAEALGIDLFLQLVKKVKLRGEVTSGVTGQVMSTASIYLQRMGAQETGSLAVPVQASFDKAGRFEINGVAPGSYVVWAEGSDAGMRLVGHASVTVSDADVDNVGVVIGAERIWKGRLVVKGGGRLNDPKQPRSLRVQLEPRSERGTGADCQTDTKDDSLKCTVMSDETYDLFVPRLPDDFYVSAVRINGTDVLTLGMSGTMASQDRPFDLVVDSRGGKVGGRVLGQDGSAWSGANVALVPDPPKGRLQAYREGYADEYGQFLMRGVAPGRYLLVAWLDDRPCNFWDPDGLAGCRATGMQVEVQQSGEENVMFTVKPLPKR